MGKKVDDRVDNGPDHIEIEQIDGLIAAAGKDVTAEIIDAFWRSTNELLEALTAQLNDRSYNIAAGTAHAIKGSASNIGASRLSDTASRLEVALKSENAEEAATLLAKSRDDFSTVKERLIEHVRLSA